MSIKIISTFENANKYLTFAEGNSSAMQSLWQEYMIEPFWADIAKWAPFDQSFKQPPYIKDVAVLKNQLPKMYEIKIDDLQSEFTNITKKLPLPSEDDEPMLVVFYPSCVGDNLHGVVGTVVFGNIIIQINPLVEGYRKWIPFVFAHEYHHNAWGYNHYVLHGGRDVQGTFLEFMITEGQADLFAESLFPGLIPKWNRPFDGDTEAALWERVKQVLLSKEHEIHSLYMFGDEKKGLPWCMGYSFGRAIVSDYISKNPQISFSELIDIPVNEIFEASRFNA